MAASPPPPTAGNIELVRWTLEIINTHQISPLREHFWTEESIQRFPHRTCRGPGELAAYFEEAFVAMPDLHMDLAAIAEAEDSVFVRWHLSGTHHGALLGIAPTQKRIEIDGMDHLVIRDERLVRGFVVFDQMQYARGLGMLPPDGSRAERATKHLFNARTRVSQLLARRLRAR